MRPMGTFLALPISPIGRIGLISLISSIFERPYGRVSFSIPMVTGAFFLGAVFPLGVGIVFNTRGYGGGL